MKRMCELFLLSGFNRILFALLLALLAASAPVSAMAQSGQSTLKSVDIDVNGSVIRLKAGSALSLNPDLPFRIVRASTDAWLDLNLEYRLKSHPSYDLRLPHTLREILGDKIFEVGQLDLQVYKGDVPVGEISLLVTPSSLDWLRRAQEAQDPGDKIRYMRKVAELNPGDELVWQTLLDMLITARQYPEATQMVTKKLADLDDPKLQRLLAELYLKQDKDAEAAAVLSKLRPDFPDDLELLATLARIYEQLRRWPEAIGVLEQLAKQQKPAQRTATLVRLADIYQTTGKDGKAIEALNQAAKLSPRDPDLWLRLAAALAKAGDRPKSLDALRAAAELKPTDIALQQRLAKAYMEDGDDEAALDHYQTLADRNPSNSGVLLALAQLYAKRDDQRALADIYGKLAALKPDDPDIGYNLAVLLLEQDKYQQALEAIKPALEAKPDDLEVLELIFEAQAGEKDYDAAAATAKKLIDLGDPREMTSLVYPVLAKYKPGKMAALLDQALKKSPNNSFLQEMRAALALEQDNPDKAIEVLRAASQARPKDLALAQRLAQLLATQGRESEALEVYGQILDQCGQCPEVEEAYMNLRTRLLEKGAK